MSQARRKGKYVVKAQKEKNKKIALLSGVIGLLAIALVAVIVLVVNLATRIPESKYPIVTMEIEGYGTVEIMLYPNDAPNTVRNFIELANSGYYDGQIISRVCENFCIQMGSPDGTLTGGVEYKIKGEFAQNGFKKNKLKHEEGTISMARSSAYDTAGSQFFICSDTNSTTQALDGAYAAFGKVISGMDIIKAISEVAHDNSISAGGGKPLTTIVVTSISVDTKGIKYPPADKIGA